MACQIVINALFSKVKDFKVTGSQVHCKRW